MQRSILRLVPFMLFLIASCLLGGCALTPEELTKEWPLPREGQWLLTNVRVEAGGYSSVILVSYNRGNTSQPSEVWYAQIRPTASNIMRLLEATFERTRPSVLTFSTLTGATDLTTGINVHITVSHPSDCIGAEHYGTTQ